ncbi:glycoside hydrolase family 3 C-terminal domain-containing protein, partial [Streptomyces sp. GbtcB7]
DVDAHHQLAREAAAQAIVLLKNEAATLPIAATDSIAIIGAFATTPRYQGGGSSHVNPTKVDVPLNEIRGHTDADVVFAHGFTVDGS